MADEHRVIQPMVIMTPPPDPEVTYDDQEANRFVEDTQVRGDLTFQQWVAQRQPLPAVAAEPESPFADDVPEV